MSGGPVAYGKKYTAASKGIWNKIREFLIPVANRSSGNPIVPMYRMPPPGAQRHNKSAHDVLSIPTNDIAENPYWKRDHRRNYPRTAVFNQSAIAGLLQYGSEAAPRIAIGNEGMKQLATVATGEISLTTTLESSSASKQVLDAQGLPPLPAPLSNKKWEIVEFEEHGMYTKDYPIRIFR